MTTSKIADRMVKKDGTMKASYYYIADRIVSEIKTGEKTARIHYCKWTGTRKHMTLIDNGYKYADMLTAFGIPFVHGNDAPRYGEEGRYIEAKFDGRNPVVSYFRRAEGKLEDMVNTVLVCESK